MLLVPLAAATPHVGGDAGAHNNDFGEGDCDYGSSYYRYTTAYANARAENYYVTAGASATCYRSSGSYSGYTYMYERSTIGASAVVYDWDTGSQTSASVLWSSYESFTSDGTESECDTQASIRGAGEEETQESFGCPLGKPPVGLLP